MTHNITARLTSEFMNCELLIPPPKNKQERANGKGDQEREDRRGRKAHVITLRHGDRGETAEDCWLTPEGIDEVVDFANFQAEKIAENSSSAIVRVLSGRRKRHRQTARTMESRFVELANTNYSHIRVLTADPEIGRTYERDYLNTDKTLGVLMELGVPYDLAFPTWKDLGKKDEGELGIVTADTIGPVLKNRIDILRDVVDKYPDGPDIYEYLVTSDTHVWSLARQIGPYAKLGEIDLTDPVDHVQAFEVRVGNYKEYIECSYQNTGITFHPDLWENM